MTRRLLILVTIVLVAGCDAGASTIPGSIPPTTLPAASAAASAASGPPAEATPAPSEAAEASPPSAAFEDISLTGTGPKVASFTIPDDEAAIVVISHEGNSKFAVSTVDADGQRIEGLVDTTGDYRGTVPIDADIDTRGEARAVAFSIEADGPWTITVKPMAAAPVWDLATTLAGTGDQVYRVVPLTGGRGGDFVSVDLAYTGDDHFLVHAYGSAGRSGLADQIGDYTEKVGVSDDTFLLGIRAGSGSWSFTPS
jgi:hypothetical protein